MAFRAALKDRARIKRQEADARRVEGRTIFHPRWGATIRARVDIVESPEAEDAAGEMSVTETPMLLLDRKDAEGGLVFLRPGDTIEVESRDFNEDGSKEWGLLGVYQIDGLPKALRKKRRRIGWEARLKLVSEAPASAGRTS